MLICCWQWGGASKLQRRFQNGMGMEAGKSKTCLEKTPYVGLSRYFGSFGRGKKNYRVQKQTGNVSDVSNDDAMTTSCHHTTLPR